MVLKVEALLHLPCISKSSSNRCLFGRFPRSIRLGTSGLDTFPEAAGSLVLTDQGLKTIHIMDFGSLFVLIRVSDPLGLVTCQ